MTREELFWSRVQKVGTRECWLWTGAIGSGGYGIFVSPAGRSAHRAAFLYAKGPIPDGLHILHSCNNPPCVNPIHLRAGTSFENGQDRAKRMEDGWKPPPKWNRSQPPLPSALMWCAGASDAVALGPFNGGMITNASVYAMQKAQGVAPTIAPEMYGKGEAASRSNATDAPEAQSNED